MASSIRIQGARVHNLKNLSLEIPRDKLVVFTGLSGSGKSSLAFDTIYAEGQRRYVESLSAYARQFLGQMDKPDVEFIEGLSPAISIDQKTASRNPRSTVGTITEIHDYLRLLFARIGVVHCHKCGKPVSHQTPQQIVDQVLSYTDGGRFLVLATVVDGRKGEYSTLLNDLAGQGFSRVRVDGVVHELAERESIQLERYEQHTIDVVLDRLTIKSANRQRLTESVEGALALTRGTVSFLFVDDDELVTFSERWPAPRCLASPNTPCRVVLQGTCRTPAPHTAPVRGLSPQSSPDAGHGGFMTCCRPAPLLGLRAPSTGVRLAWSSAEIRSTLLMTALPEHASRWIVHPSRWLRRRARRCQERCAGTSQQGTGHRAILQADFWSKRTVLG